MKDIAFSRHTCYNNCVLYYYNTKSGKIKAMFSILSNFFQKNGIELYAALPLRHCKIRKPYLLERAEIPLAGTAVLFAVPYRTPACDENSRNLSAYAVSKDYHAYFAGLFDALLPILQNAFPNARFAGFADHSPIDEVDAAARASLGMLGENGLLITQKHSSFVFLGGIYTSLSVDAAPCEPARCEGCGACHRACPAKDTCLSALTQKKGALTPKEEEEILGGSCVWGCDVCQDVCPYTARARKAGTLYTSIPYFYDHPIPTLTDGILDGMTDAAFSERAYAWRGKETVQRNLQLFKKGEPPC